MDQVLDLLRRSDRSFRRARGAYRRLLIALLLVVGPFYIGSLIFAGVGLVHAWQGGDWLEMFWLPFAIAAPFATSLTKFAVIPDDRQVLYQPIADLRVAIRSGDEALAPKAELAVSAAPPLFDPTGRTRIGPLRRPQSTAGTVYMICGGLALMALIISVPAAIAAGSSLAALIVSATLAPLACLLLLVGVRTLGSFSVNADASGLRWRRPSGRRVHLAWTDAHALFEVHRIAGLYGNPETHFVVSGERAALAWRLPNAILATAASARSADLCRLVTEHTGLPLRNATTEAQRIASQAEPKLVFGVRMQSKPSSHEIRRRFKMLGLIASPALLLALVGGGLQLAQPAYYEHLYAQAHSHAPIHIDPMTSDIGYWPAGKNASFTSGAYTVLSGGALIDAVKLAPVRYNDALLEITARTNGSFYGTTSDQGGPGFFIQNALNDARSMTFNITVDGEYWIDRFWDDSSVPTIGNDPAIAKGYGASNRLAMLIQGSQYTFYVNGHYAGGFNDGDLAGGAIGLYAGFDDVSFSDFAVYPLN